MSEKRLSPPYIGLYVGTYRNSTTDWDYLHYAHKQTQYSDVYWRIVYHNRLRISACRALFGIQRCSHNNRDAGIGICDNTIITIVIAVRSVPTLNIFSAVKQQASSVVEKSIFYRHCLRSLIGAPTIYYLPANQSNGSGDALPQNLTKLAEQGTKTSKFL